MSSDGESAKQLKLSDLLVEMQNSKTLGKPAWPVLKMLNIHLLYHPAILISEIYPGEMKAFVCMKI